MIESCTNCAWPGLASLVALSWLCLSGTLALAQTDTAPERNGDSWPVATPSEACLDPTALDRLVLNPGYVLNDDTLLVGASIYADLTKIRGAAA